MVALGKTKTKKHLFLQLAVLHKACKQGRLLLASTQHEIHDVNTNSPLKCGHPTNQGTLPGPKGSLISRSLLYREKGD